MVNEADATPGEQLEYTIRLVNEGGKDAQAVNVQDELPADVTYLSGPLVDPPDAGDGFYDYAHRIIIWNGDLNAGAVVSLTYSVWVNSPLNDGTIIENTANLNYQGTLTLGPISTTVHSAPDLTNSTKTVDRALATAGEEIEYTITLVNDGNMNDDVVWMTDTLPANVTYEDDLWWSHGAAAYASGVVTWTGPVDVGEPATIRYKVRLADTLGGGDVVTNVATVNDGFAGHIPFEIGPAVTEIGSAFSVSIDDGRETVVPGELLTYTITFRGEDPVDDGAAMALIPEHTQFYAATGNYSSNESGYVNWNLPPLSSNFEESVMLVVQVDPILPDLTLIENQTTFSGEGESAQDDDTTTVTSAPNMSTSLKQVDKLSAYAGQELLYTIILTNTGTMHASAVVMTDTIPEYTSYVAGSVSGGSYDPVAQTITWEGDLNVGNSVEIQFSVVITELEFIRASGIYNVASIDDGYDLVEVEAETLIPNSIWPDRYKIYMPTIVKGFGYVLEPDIELVIQNCGDTDAIGAFWVDLYIDPDESSAHWPISHGEGHHWFGQGAGFVVDVLGAGQSLTLYLDDAAVTENLPASLPASPRLYAQVDWVDSGAIGSGLGVVDEGPGGEANNVADSGGNVCNATPGKPDLIVVSVTRVWRMVSIFDENASQQVNGTRIEGIKAPPPRPQP
jgi:uncharacterized repeat protein (TIGR01451 family)